VAVHVADRRSTQYYAECPSERYRSAGLDFGGRGDIVAASPAEMLVTAANGVRWRWLNEGDYPHEADLPAHASGISGAPWEP
jgi:hypothetical protein